MLDFLVISKIFLQVYVKFIYTLNLFDGFEFFSDFKNFNFNVPKIELVIFEDVKNRGDFQINEARLW